MMKSMFQHPTSNRLNLKDQRRLSATQNIFRRFKDRGRERVSALDQRRALQNPKEEIETILQSHSNWWQNRRSKKLKLFHSHTLMIYEIFGRCTPMQTVRWVDRQWWPIQLLIRDSRRKCSNSRKWRKRVLLTHLVTLSLSRLRVVVDQEQSQVRISDLLKVLSLWQPSWRRWK